MSELIDNRAHRIRTLKEIIKHLHEGTAPEQAKARLKQLVREASDEATISELIRVTADSEDVREGLAAMRERRAPTFTGR